MKYRETQTKINLKRASTLAMFVPIEYNMYIDVTTGVKIGPIVTLNKWSLGFCIIFQCF